MPRKHNWLWAIPLVFIGITFYLPVTTVLNLGFGSQIAGSNQELGIWPILWFTIWQALLSTLICLLIGVPAAYIFYRRSFPGSNFLRSIITVPFMLPSLIVAMAIIELGRPFGGFNPIVAILIANVFSNYAVVVRNVGSQWANISVSLEEESELSGAGRLATAFKVVLPQLASSIRSSAAIIALYCASSYGIVLSLGGGQVNTLETALSISVLQRLDLQHGAALALLQILFTITAFWVSRIGGTNPLGFDTHVGKTKNLDRRDLPAALFSFATVTFLVILPLCLVLMKALINTDGSFSFSNFLILDSKGYRDLLNITFVQAGFNSLRNLVISTFLAMLIGGITSYLLAERSRQKKIDRLGIVLDGIFLMPVGISAVVLGLGYLIAFTGSFAFIRSSWLIVPIVQSVVAIPLVIRILYPAFISIDESPREQARTDGAKSFQVFQYIDLALVKPALKTAMVFSALVSIGEFGIASLLSYGDQATVPVLLYQLISRPGNNNYQMALAVASLLTVITTILVLWVSKETKTSRKQLRR